MKEYHKIQTVFHRSPESNFKHLIEGVFALPEFDLLQNINWIWTEKIDGTNIRVLWDGSNVSFGGKTDKADIPLHLLSVLQTTFTPEKMKNTFGDTNNVCLYGEGYGMKIQSGGNYIPDGADFILFDVKIDQWWLTRENIEGIAQKLDIAIVPVIGEGTLLESVEFARQGYVSTIAHNKSYMAEGLIMKPSVELFNRKGERIISKIKYRDFQK